MKYLDMRSRYDYNLLVMTPRPILKLRLSNQVYDVIKEMIVAHRFLPGTRVNIEEIAKELGVSRTPVWEAVHRLIQEGLLYNVPNRGVFMATLSPSRALDLYSVRQVLEGLAAQLAVPRFDNEMLKKMKKCLDVQQKVILRNDLAGYSKLDFEFHSLIYEACGNQVLQEMLETLKNKMRPLAMHISKTLSDLYNDHMEIYEAFEKGDPRAAQDAFDRHNCRMIALIQGHMDGEEWKEVGERQAAEDGEVRALPSSRKKGKSPGRKAI